jgi:hypothetical protein
VGKRTEEEVIKEFIKEAREDDLLDLDIFFYDEDDDE